VPVFGVSPDSLAKHAKFTAKYELSVDLVSDEDLALANAWGVWAQKKMFGRTYMGVLRTTFLVGRDGRIARVWKKVRVKGHAEEVLQAAKAL
jgi:peroxiredoxin Q/BCP